MTAKEPLSPDTLIAEKMQMMRTDVKPGNGTSLLAYCSHESHRQKLSTVKPIVDARATEFYL